MSTDVLAIIAIALGALTRALGSDLPGFKSLSKAWRAVIVAGIGIAQGIVDMAAAGTPIKIAAVSVLKTTVPSFVLLWIEAIFGGGGIGPDAVANGGGKAAGQQPSPYGSAKLVRGPWSRAWFGALAVCACFAVGCGVFAQIPQWIQQALVIEQNAAAIINALRAAKDLFFAITPVSDNVKKSVEQGFQDADLSLAAITNLLNAGDAVTQEQLDAAWTDFKNAYANLTQLLVQIGAVEKDAEKGTLRARRGNGTQAVLPLAFKVRIVK